MVGRGYDKPLAPPRPPLAAIRRRQDKVVEWTLQNYSMDQIARSLYPPVRVGTVSSDRAARRADLLAGDSRKKIIPPRASRPDPEPYDWLTPPVPVARPAYQLADAPMAQVAALLASLRATNGLAKLPFNIDEAASREDDGWFAQQQITLMDLISLLQDMLDVFQLEDARRAARSPAARQDLRPVRPSEHVLSGNAQEFPGKNSGILPGRVFQMLLAWHWAGKDITSGDQQMVTSIVKRGASVARVLAAAEEMKPALKDAGWD